MPAKILYWFLVVIVSLVFVVALILFLESRDESELEGSGVPMPARLLT